MSDIVDRIKKKNALIECYYDLISKHRKELQELIIHCPHNFVTKSKSDCGDYYNYAQTITWNECEYCKIQINRRYKSHGYYG